MVFDFDNSDNRRNTQRKNVVGKTLRSEKVFFLEKPDQENGSKAKCETPLRKRVADKVANEVHEIKESVKPENRDIETVQKPKIPSILAMRNDGKRLRKFTSFLNDF
jgi:hypothetical protein